MKINKNNNSIPFSVDSDTEYNFCAYKIYEVFIILLLLSSLLFSGYFVMQHFAENCILQLID